MGRHRPDPRGHARILIAAAAVVLAIALLVVGGVALWGALTSEPAGPAPGASRADPPASTEAAPSNRQPQSATASRPALEALVVRCRAAQCGVFISASPSNEVLFNGRLRQGEVRQYDEPLMNLVVSDGSTVDVFINGKLQVKGAAGKRRTYTVDKS